MGCLQRKTLHWVLARWAVDGACGGGWSDDDLLPCKMFEDQNS